MNPVRQLVLVVTHAVSAQQHGRCPPARKTVLQRSISAHRSAAVVIQRQQFQVFGPGEYKTSGPAPEMLYDDQNQSRACRRITPVTEVDNRRPIARPVTVVAFAALGQNDRNRHHRDRNATRRRPPRI